MRIDGHQARIPGSFSFLGINAADWETRHSVHHPLFKVDENALPIGAAWRKLFLTRSLNPRCDKPRLGLAGAFPKICRRDANNEAVVAHFGTASGAASRCCMDRFARNMLLLGGGMSVAMALYHFFLPFQFHWAKFVEEIPAVIRWSLFALNFFFSDLLLVMGLLVLATGWTHPRDQPLALLIVGGAASFWLVNFAYLMIFPFPMPPSMYGVKLGLQSFAAASFLLHGIPFAWLIATRHRLRNQVTAD